MHFASNMIICWGISLACALLYCILVVCLMVSVLVCHI